MLDAFKGHLVLDVRSVIHAVNTDLVVILGAKAQLHIPVNKLLKDHLKQLYSEWLMIMDHVLTSTRTIKPVVERACQWIKTIAMVLSRSDSQRM
jgi:hypothetical protein